MSALKNRAVTLLRASERYTKTDMLYLVSGSFWLILTRVFLVLISLAVSIVFGHYATQDTYGNYRYALILAGLFGALSLSGLSTGVTQSAARGFDGALRQGFKMSLRWSAGLVLAGLLGAAYYYFFQHNVFLALTCLLVSVFAPFLNSASLYDAYLVGKKEFKLQALYDTFDALLPALLLIAALFFSKRAIILIVAYFVANTGAALFFYFRSLRIAKNNAADPELFRYSAHLSVINIINVIAGKIDGLSVFAFLGPAELALYAYAIAMPDQIKSLVSTLVSLALPRFAGRTMPEIRETLWHRIGLLALGLGAALLFYIALAPVLFKFLFPVYENAVPYSIGYAASLILAALIIPLETVFQAQKKTKALHITINTSSVLIIVLMPTLTYMYGIWGAIAAQTIYRIAIALLLLWQFFVNRE